MSGLPQMRFTWMPGACGGLQVWRSGEPRSNCGSSGACCILLWPWAICLCRTEGLKVRLTMCEERASGAWSPQDHLSQPTKHHCHPMLSSPPLGTRSSCSEAEGPECGVENTAVSLCPAAVEGSGILEFRAPQPVRPSVQLLPTPVPGPRARL